MLAIRESSWRPVRDGWGWDNGRLASLTAAASRRVTPRRQNYEIDVSRLGVGGVELTLFLLESCKSTRLCIQFEFWDLRGVIFLYFLVVILGGHLGGYV